MLFNSYIFIFAFLPVALIGFFLIGPTSRRGAGVWLALCSFAFYGWWKPSLIFLLALSMAFNYGVSVWIQRNEASPGKQQGILVFGIAIDLLVLFYYKYFV